MIRVNLSKFKKKELIPKEKLTVEEHHDILPYFVGRVIQTKSQASRYGQKAQSSDFSFVLIDKFDDIDNKHKYFLKIKIYKHANTYSISVLISTLLHIIVHFLKKDIDIIFNSIRYKGRDWRRSEQRIEIDKGDFDKLEEFFKENEFAYSEKFSYYIKRKFGLEKKICNLEKIYSKNMFAIEVYLLGCKLLNRKPLKRHVADEDEVLNEFSEFFS